MGEGERNRVRQRTFGGRRGREAGKESKSTTLKAQVEVEGRVVMGDRRMKEMRKLGCERAQNVEAPFFRGVPCRWPGGAAPASPPR